MKAVRLAVEQGECWVHRACNGTGMPVTVLRLCVASDRGSQSEFSLCRECAQVVAKAAGAIAFIEQGGR